MAASVERLIEHFHVDRVVILQSMPAPAPHTRPVHVTGYASDQACWVTAKASRGSSRWGLVHEPADAAARRARQGRPRPGCARPALPVRDRVPGRGPCTARPGRSGRRFGAADRWPVGAISPGHPAPDRVADRAVARGARGRGAARRAIRTVDRPARPDPAARGAQRGRDCAEVEEFLKGLDRPDEQ